MKFCASEQVTYVAVRFFIFMQEIVYVLAMLSVFAMNIWMVRLARNSRRAAGRKESKKDKSFARQSLIMSCTNFLQWFVIFPVSALSLSGYNIDSKILAWLAIMGLPANSVVNPIIYTMSTTHFKYWILKKNIKSFRE